MEEPQDDRKINREVVFQDIPILHREGQGFESLRAHKGFPCMGGLFLYTMFYTYILYSRVLDKFYIGYTENLEARLIKHNQFHKGFTGRAKDWEIKFVEGFVSKTEAMSREKQIKRWKSRKMIEKLIGK
ncbi:hypothetical protein HME9304_00878 [Flagellimonas maritima]|uniref:GIY-YIG domain-containing protein n=2 Tax=Flagellimonas maritima TaxID=1383885 RepID=A0A2Z4LPZ7_9FLAO|nr:hypothetical protein HME9304_00878 [Allomuricauda aurantiaca]